MTEDTTRTAPPVRGIDIRELTVRHPDSQPPAIDEVSLRIAPGECLLVTGASGCGKTTLLQCVNGLIPTEIPAELHGTITIGGSDVATVTGRDLARRVGMVFQDPRAEFFTFDVLSELAFPCENFAMDPAAIRRRIDNVADLLHMRELLSRKLSELSSGQKQRVAIAAAMMPDPGVLLLDEPSANLDSEGMEELAHVLHLLKDHGVATVVADHRFRYLAGVIDRCVILDHGRLIDNLSATELISKPDTWFAAHGLRHLSLPPAPERPLSSTPQGTAGMHLRDLECSYPGHPTLWKIDDLAFPSTGIVGIFGPNGVGKTSLLRVLMGIHRRTRGTITLHGRSCNRRQRRTRFAYVMQDVDYQLTAETVIDELTTGHPDIPETRDRANQLLVEMDLSDLRDRHPLTLSGGQKQRLGIALACMKDADVMCLDEPTSGLDQANMQRVCTLLRRLAERMLVIVVTHDDEFARTAIDHTVSIANGTATLTPTVHAETEGTHQ